MPVRMPLPLKRVLVAVLAGPLIGLLWLLADATRPYLKGNAPVLVDIPRGTRTAEIARQLEAAGVIRSQWTFLAAHLLRPGNTLKAGEYEFDRPASAFAVLGKLVRGEVSYEEITVTEGSNRFEIADLVAAQGYSTREEFLRATEDPTPILDLDPDAETLEGYLFPDTYRLPRHARPAEIVRRMVEQFRKVYESLGPPTTERSVREVVTIASLVEKETALPHERPLVAGVFYNRLRRNIALQADPTVAYALFLAKGWKGRLRLSDLDFPSPYNTYVNRGLPAGPIANAGRASLRAALHPAATDYLYFVANGDGGHTFSRTLAEHNRAVAQYRQSQSETLAQNDASPSGAALSQPAAPTIPPR